MDTTEFMLNLNRQLLKERQLAETTVNAYLKVLYQLNGKKAFKNLTFLKKTEEIDEKIKEYAPSTQKSIRGSLVGVLSLVKDKPSFKKAYQHYKTGMEEGRKVEEAKIQSGEKTEKQEKNWMEWAEVQKVKTDLGDKLVPFANKKTATPEQYETLLHYLILSLYTDIQPRRNQDYLDMYIVKKWNEKLPTDKNYYDLSTNRFIFNKYKTMKTYGIQIEEVKEPLVATIHLFLKFHPLWKGVVKRQNNPIKLLALADGTPMVAVNGITRILNKVFGKKVGSSMLRHSFLSSKYADVAEEMKGDASAMAHSTSVQRRYIKKNPRVVKKTQEPPVCPSVSPSPGESSSSCDRVSSSPS
jgi:integrase